MACYAITSATQAYDYYQLNCTVGALVPNASNTGRDTLILINGDWVRTSRTTQTITNSTQLVVGELPIPATTLHYSDVILPAVLICGAFAAMIMRMFMGVRRR